MDDIDWNTKDFWAVFWSLFFSIFFTIIAVFAFAAFAFFLVVRMIHIWFLLILAPIVWLLWVLPFTSKFFKQWWDSFIKWVFFAPIAVFFLWLAVTSWNNFSENAGLLPGAGIGESMEETVPEGWAAANLLPETAEPNAFVQFLIACGLLFGSLIVAQTAGVYGAGAVIGAAAGTAKWAANKTPGWAHARRYGQALQARSREKEAGKQAKTRGKVDRMMTGLKLATTPQRMQRRTARLKREQEMQEAGKGSEFEKVYGGLSNGALRQQFGKSKDNTEKLAIGRILSSRDALEGIERSELQAMVKVGAGLGQLGSILKSRPDLAPDGLEVGLGSIKPSDIGKISKASFTNKDGSFNDDALNTMTKQFGADGKMNQNHLVEMHKENPDLYRAMKPRIVDAADRGLLRDDVKRYVRSAPGEVIYSRSPAGGGEAERPR